MDVGNNKMIFTTQESIATNACSISLGSTANGSIKCKDFRIFKLPIGSIIESDFANLTVDQLAVKYPYVKGGEYRGVGSGRLVSTDGINTKYLYYPSVGYSYLMVQ